MNTNTILLLTAAVCSTAVPAGAVRPSAVEMAEARQWVAAKFEGTRAQVKHDGVLIVSANNDPVQRNGRAGRPMTIAGKSYDSGLYCHAVSEVVVRLPGPGRTFTATVGVDSNEQTSGGRGSVVFSVEVGGKQAVRTGVMREGIAGKPVKVNLDGAREFVLRVGDSGDGIACDQSDWADARVILEDGSQVLLGDLPIEGESSAYSFDLPFSFIYGGRSSADLITPTDIDHSSRELGARRTEHTLTWLDPGTGLQVRCVAIEYHDYPTVEWTVYLKNTGDKDTPIIENIQAFDTQFQRKPYGEFILHHQIGSPYSPTDYEPFATQLDPGAKKVIGAAGGRSTNSDLSYFNVQWPEGGAIVVVGWPGQWSASFERDSGTGLKIVAGQELTRLKLHPGEEIRTPLMVVQFYAGDWVRAQNIWRRWMQAHSMPMPGRKLPPPHLAACSSHFFHEMVFANDKSQMQFVDRYLDEKVKLDYWWMDAGWYKLLKTNPAALWVDTGTWEVAPERFPNGLRAVSDHAHAKGVNIIVWFEPERVAPGTWLYENHPEWMLRVYGSDGKPQPGSHCLLNLGDPEALKWLTAHTDGLLNSQAIDLYREDFNIDPLAYWRTHDADDRQGITENHYIVAHLAYWDELRRRHPRMLIDSCASGGRRNDLETLRRAVPLLRSDYILEPVSQQNHSYGIAYWIPFYGTGLNSTTSYGFRSCMCPALNTCYDVRRKDLDYDSMRRLTTEWREVAPNYYGDYYPLTSFNPGADAWMAWQFDRPESGEGMIQVFRRDASPYEAARFKLHGLDPDAQYSVTDIDTGKSKTYTGRTLMEKGLAVTMKDLPSAAVITYRKQ